MNESKNLLFALNNLIPPPGSTHEVQIMAGNAIVDCLQGGQPPIANQLAAVSFSGMNLLEVAGAIAQWREVLKQIKDLFNLVYNQAPQATFLQHKVGLAIPQFQGQVQEVINRATARFFTLQAVPTANCMPTTQPPN